MISVMQWINDFRFKALHDGDDERLRLTDFYFRARAVSHEAPDQKLATFRAGGELARRLNEPWWVMFYEFWQISTLLVHQLKVTDALDLATRAVLEVAKPLYDGFPGRPNLNLLLVSVYMEIDPIWHESQIRATFNYLRDGDSWLGFPAFLAQQWSHFLDVTKHPDATTAAWEYLSLGDEINSDHYRASALLLLCKLLDGSEPDTARASLGDLASQAEIYARNRKNDRFLALALMWRAVAARQSGRRRERTRIV